MVAPIAQRHGLPLIDVRLSQMEPSDLRGILFRDGHHVVWVPPSVSAATYQPILDRRLSEYPWPAHWTLFAAGNRQGDRGVTYAMPLPLTNRFAHFTVETHLESWVAWTFAGGIDERLIAFLRLRPELLFDFDPSRGGMALPTLRAWEFAHRAQQKFAPDSPLLPGVLCACVGQAAGIECAAYLNHLHRLPDIDAIVAGQDVAPPTSLGRGRQPGRARLAFERKYRRAKPCPEPRRSLAQPRDGRHAGQRFGAPSRCRSPWPGQVRRLGTKCRRAVALRMKDESQHDRHGVLAEKGAQHQENPNQPNLEDGDLGGQVEQKGDRGGGLGAVPDTEPNTQARSPNPAAQGSSSAQSPSSSPQSPNEIEHLARTWQSHLAAAARQACKAGKLVGDWARLIERSLQRNTDWRTLLARLLTQSAREDYSWSRPNRREDAMLRPALYSHTSEIAVALDVSGSVSEKDLARFVGEVDALKAELPARITLLACDARLAADGPWVFEPWEHSSLPRQFAGGGTSFKPVFDWVEQYGCRPDVLVYCTDAEDEFPAHEPDYPVLWLIKGSATVPRG